MPISFSCIPGPRCSPLKKLLCKPVNLKCINVDLQSNTSTQNLVPKLSLKSYLPRVCPHLRNSKFSVTCHMKITNMTSALNLSAFSLLLFQHWKLLPHAFLSSRTQRYGQEFLHGCTEQFILIAQHLRPNCYKGK